MSLRHGNGVRGAPAAAVCALLFLAGSAPGETPPDPGEALRKAAKLFEAGQLAEAERTARSALADPGSQPVAYSVLGAIRLQQKRYEESASLLRRAVKLEPRLAGAHLNLAQVYTLQGKNAAAVAVYRRVLALDRSNALARFALAREEAEAGRYKQSLELARPVAGTLKTSADGLFLLATDFLKTGGGDAARGLAGDWMQLAGTPPAWSIKFALLLANHGLRREAIEILERARQAWPASYELAFNLAGVYLLDGEEARALETYDIALTLDSASVPALEQAAGVAERRGELERALSYWMRAKKRQPDAPEILFGFGQVCLKMDLLDDAEPALERAAALRPGESAYRYALASAKVGKRQFDAARAILEELVSRKPDAPQLRYALGSVLYLQGRLDEAAAHLRESARLQPEQVASYYYLGLIERDQGRQADAIQTLQQVVRRHPDHAPSYEALGGLLMSQRRYPEAESSLEKAVHLNPKSVKANYQLGLLLSRMGKKEQSDQRFEIAKSLRQEDETTSRLQLRLLEPDR